MKILFPTQVQGWIRFPRFGYLEEVPLVLKTYEKRRQAVFPYTLHVQWWTGIGSSQWTLLFKQDLNRGTQQSLVHSKSAVQRGIPHQSPQQSSAPSETLLLSAVLCTLPDLLSHLSSSTRNQQYLQLNILGLLPFYRSSGAQRPFLVLCYSVPLD